MTAISQIPQSFKDLPDYDDLPDKARFWQWGPAGSETEGLGILNLQTPELVARAAAQEIRTGDRTGLGWQFHLLDYPGFKRREFGHKIKWSTYPWSLDDEYELNPQQSSQWDGFRHHSQQLDRTKTRDEQAGAENADQVAVWFGGTTPSEIISEGVDGLKSPRIGIHFWANKGLSGRGVLLDYATWAEEQGIKYSTFDSHAIAHADLLKVAERFNVKFEPGDLLFVRIGLTKEWLSHDAKWKRDIQVRTQARYAGLAQSTELMRWIWNNHFTALASDSVSFEVYPNPIQDPALSVHQTCLAGWGVPIGELFDLDALADLCKRHGRYSFFVTSMPFNAVGGVSSPPNAMAIF
ncbi:hypothetical protein V1514DRAFT_333056 [Lipomyces japonicus]|uniref:uncharacterized protein n=1 Tax=Lipomyces japonicus TaxID=56871 RepID=UPI0034CDE3C6